MFKTVFIRDHDYGLRFDRGQFTGLVEPGTHRYLDPFGRIEVRVVSQREPFLNLKELDLVVRAGVLQGKAEILDLNDDQRALVWIDNRLTALIGPGLYAYWTGFRKVRVQVLQTEPLRLEHAELERIALLSGAATHLQFEDVPAEHAGVLRVNGRYVETLPPGKAAFWKAGKGVKVASVDLRETMLDIGGQELLTADKVTVRMNIVAVYRVADPVKAVTTIDNVGLALHREAQLALRGAVAVRELDVLLAEREALATELTETLKARAAAFGVEVAALGVRDIILPGEMRDLLNKVIEARKAAEAGVITRREEAAGLRHQANAAKLYAENATLLRLRELEAVEKIAAAGRLKVVLGEKGLADRIVNLM